MIEYINDYKSRCSYIAGKIKTLTSQERMVFNSLSGEEEKLMMLGIQGTCEDKKAMRMYLVNPSIW